MSLKVLIVIPGTGLAHEVRGFYIGKHLYEKGFKVSLAINGSPKFIEWLKSLEHVDLECRIYKCRGAKLGNFKLDLYTLKSAISDFVRIEKLLNDLDPDLVLSDVSPLMPLACEKLGIVHASLVSASWTNYYSPDRPSLRGDWIGELLVNPFRKLIRRYMSLSFNKNLSNWANPLDTLAGYLGLKAQRNILSYLAGNDLTLITDIEEVGPLDNPPSYYKYCGPITWHPPFHSSELIKTLNPNKRTIYLSFGTGGEFSILKRLVHWCLQEDYQVIMTLGRMKLLPEQMSQHPNVKVAKFINAWDVIPSCDAVIFHGGIGTAYQALGCGKPSIAIPFHIEQCWNAYRLEELGVGTLLHPQLVSRKRVISAINKAISDKNMHKRIKRLTHTVTSSDGAKRTADLIAEHCVIR